jgi:plasmid stability protein
MPSITVKNIPDHTFATLKDVAANHHRSVNSEIIYLIEKATTSKAFQPDRHLVLAKRSREKTKKFLLTEELLELAKEEGR